MPTNPPVAASIFNDVDHLIGALLDRIEMAPNDDPVPYIREYVEGLRTRKSPILPAPPIEGGATTSQSIKRIKACVSVDVGGGAFMAAPLGELEWQLRYGNVEAVRFEAASVVASYRYLIYLSKKEAWHRLQRIRHDLNKTGGKS